MSYLSYNYIYKIKSVFIVSRDFIYLSILNPSLPIFSKIKRIRQTLANLVSQRCPGQHWVLVKERLTSTVFLGPFYIKLTSVFLRAILHGQQKAESEGCPYMPWVKLSAYQDSAELLWRCREKAFLNIWFAFFIFMNFKEKFVYADPKEIYITEKGNYLKAI